MPTDPDPTSATFTTPIPEDIGQALGELESDYLNRLLLLQKATEQRAHMLGVEITRVVSKLSPVNPLPPAHE